MGAAAVISLAEVREKKQRTEYRRQLHEQFDLWLDTLEEQMTEPKPTLEQITRAVWEVRQELTGGLAEALVEQRYRTEHEQRNAPCPQWCDENLRCTRTRPACATGPAAGESCGPSAGGFLCAKGLVCCSRCRSEDASVPGCDYTCSFPCNPGDYQPGLCQDGCVHDVNQ